MKLLGLTIIINKIKSGSKVYETNLARCLIRVHICVAFIIAESSIKLSLLIEDSLREFK